jgi:predicted transcriptional regulator
VKDFGTSQSPKSTRLRDNLCAPPALRSALDSTNTRRAQHRPQWLDGVSDVLADFLRGYGKHPPFATTKIRPDLRLPGTTSLRFALHGWQRLLEDTMSRLTISLNDELHQALREMAARQKRSITSIIEESLTFRGIRTQSNARELVARARENADLSEEEALAIAVTETRHARGS